MKAILKDCLTVVQTADWMAELKVGGRVDLMVDRWGMWMAMQRVA